MIVALSLLKWSPEPPKSTTNKSEKSFTTSHLILFVYIFLLFSSIKLFGRRRWKLVSAQVVSCMKSQNNRDSTWRTITNFVWQLGRCEPSSPVCCWAPMSSILILRNASFCLYRSSQILLQIHVKRLMVGHEFESWYRIL